MKTPVSDFDSFDETVLIFCVRFDGSASLDRDVQSGDLSKLGDKRVVKFGNVVNLSCFLFSTNMP